MKRIAYIMILGALFAACSRESERPAASMPLAKDPMTEVKERLTINPRDADAWFRLSDLYDRAGMYAEEADALNKAVGIDPSMGYAYIKLGTAYNRLAKYREAVSSFQKAKKFQPSNPVLYNNLAFSLGKLGRTGEEIAALRQAITLRPRYTTARYNLGMAYLKKGLRQEALLQYEALRKIDEGAAAALKKELDARRR